MIRNSLICKLINVQASMKENKEKKINNCDEISKLIKAFPKEKREEDQWNGIIICGEELWRRIIKDKTQKR